MELPEGTPTYIESALDVVDIGTNEFETIRGRWSVYLCPHCDNTHIQLALPDGSIFSASWPPQIAETFAKMLINPRIPGKGDLKHVG